MKPSSLKNTLFSLIIPIYNVPIYGIAHRIREDSTNQKQKKLHPPVNGHYLVDLYNDIMNRDIQNFKLCEWICSEARKYKLSIE